MVAWEHHVQVDIVDAEKAVDISGQFDGAKHYSISKGFLSYINPGGLSGQGGLLSKAYRHRDILHRITWKPRDTQRYISPTYGKPYHLVVQATREVLADKTGSWRRTEVSGNAPWLLRLSSWALKEALNQDRGPLTAGQVTIICLKVFAVVPLQLSLLAFPFSRPTWVSGQYKGLPARCFEYPLYALNELDARPNTVTNLGNAERQLTASKEHDRLLSPRRLVVWGEEGWKVETSTAGIPYVFVSYTRRHWDPDQPDTLGPLHKIARHLARSCGLRAYWLDHQCIPQHGDVTDDVHQICDVIRGANQVCVAVPNLDLDTLAVWGSRMWTMPEVLICQNSMITFCAMDRSTMERSRISLADGIWGNDQAARLLAEHFSGTLTLSRLELVQVALKALSSRQTKALYSNGDLAYALMGLLNRRPKANINDTQFQALARLSLANDSDRVVERMLCMLPTAEVGSGESNRKFVLEDELHANLWDIEPLCQVAGVCAENGIMLDGCRGASIRWKDIPVLGYVRRESFKRKIMGFGLCSGPYWFLLGVIFCATRQIGAGAFFLILGLLLIYSSPWSIMILYGGKVWGAVPWLVGIEGVMPIEKIEKFAFGNSIGRLRWAPSSSILDWKSYDERLGVEPAWIKGNGPKPVIPDGHRIFTLVDTGTMTCHVFTAERPPSAALIVGREGGMLRVVLASYERSSATMIKETVLRMETPMMDRAGKSC